MPGDPPIPIDANHITIAKPLDRSALLYVRTQDFISEYPEQRRPTAFYARQLPTIRSEQQWNIIPKLPRIAAIVVVIIIAFKGVQALISPPSPDEEKVAQRLVEAQKPLFTESQKPLDDKLERLLVLTASEKGVELAPLRAILVKMGEAGVPDQDIPKRLDEKANELVRLRAEIDRLRRGPASLVSFGQQAQTLIDKGDLDGARAALAGGRTAARTPPGRRPSDLSHSPPVVSRAREPEHHSKWTHASDFTSALRSPLARQGRRPLPTLSRFFLAGQHFVERLQGPLSSGSYRM